MSPYAWVDKSCSNRIRSLGFQIEMFKIIQKRKSPHCTLGDILILTDFTVFEHPSSGVSSNDQRGPWGREMEAAELTGDAGV